VVEDEGSIRGERVESHGHGNPVGQGASVDIENAPRYRSGVDNLAQGNEADRKNWIAAKARGKTRFIWREAMRGTLVGLVYLPAVQAFANRGHVFSLQFLVIWLITLAICLLGGYLTGRWRWDEFETKYRE
jgi:hypothetical protein